MTLWTADPHQDEPLTPAEERITRDLIEHRASPASSLALLAPIALALMILCAGAVALYGWLTR
jgi:hypothetical protein